MAVFAIIEAIHSDFCPGSFTSRGEAEAALARIIESDPRAKGRYDIVELDELGFPVGEVAPSPSSPVQRTK